MSTSATVIEFTVHNLYSPSCPASCNSHNSMHYTITISLGEECKIIRSSFEADKVTLRPLLWLFISFFKIIHYVDKRREECWSHVG